MKVQKVSDNPTMGSTAGNVEIYYDTEFCMVSFVTDHFSYWNIGEKTTMSEHKDMPVR